jgi:secreted trypsin-like serine protease
VRPARALGARLALALLIAALCAGGAASASGSRGPTAGASIVGGQAAAQGAYPWMTAVVFAGEPNAYKGLFCGGSLVAPRTVLTAAHCVLIAAAQRTVPANQLDVVVGAYNLKRGDGERIRVRKIIVQPQRLRNPRSNKFDVALLRLSRPATAPTIPVAAPGQESLWAPGADVRVIGFGVLHPRLPYRPGRLFQTDITTVSNTDCEQDYGTVFDYRTMLCAGAPGRDSCQGDSGGPLIADHGGSWIQVGLVSFGEGCARQGFPGVYAQIEGMRDFILASRGRGSG